MTKTRRTYNEFTRRRVVVPLGTPRVKSEFKDECDINRIVARIKKTGDMSRLALENSWKESDFTTIPTNYTDASLLVMNVRDKFLNLSSKERRSFDNDPALWIADLEAKQKASYEAAKASHNASVKEAGEEAAYRKKRREPVLKPSADDAKK